jgi:hypothetical protein
MELAMRSPWVDLLFLHGYATPTQLAWRPDAAPCGRPMANQVEVDVATLPLSDRCGERDCACCA